MEDFANDEICEVFQENELVVCIFSHICNQWRAGPNGLFALDYTTLNMMFDIYEVAIDKKLGILQDIGVMEVVALEELDKR